MQPLPRRQPLAEIEGASTTPPGLQGSVFKVGRLRVAWRFGLWLGVVIFWYTEFLFDLLRHGDTTQRKAARLRGILERMGGAGIKIGQQVSLRTDILPYAYAVELTKLLDKLPQFSVKYAIARIEKQTGKPLDEVFSAFDPDPIGSASIACVYQAVLRNGDKVAVKVRRPGIGERIVADCEALAWLLRGMELLTLIRPGLSGNFLFEFRSMLTEELDFIQEARYAEIFRRHAKKFLHYVTAPQVYFEYSGEDVMIAEFVSGISMNELIAAVEQKDQKTLAHLRELNIRPEIVAKRLIRAHHTNLFENIMFHADPHPANVLVAPGNKLIFIDFGSCGAFTSRELHLWRKFIEYEQRADVGRMAQCALAILEPLPAVDIDELTKKLEAAYWRDIYALRSEHTKWFERTSARTWISLLKLAREYDIKLNFNSLRIIRATLLYDTVAARLYNKLDTFREHRRYNRSAARRSRERMQKGFFKRLLGPTDSDYQRLEQIIDMGDRMVYLTQRFLDTSPYRFSMMIEKPVYAFMRLLDTGITLALGAFALVFITVLYRLAFTDGFSLATADFWAIFKGAASGKVFLLFAGITVFLNLRRIQFRLHDRPILRGNTSGLS